MELGHCKLPHHESFVSHIKAGQDSQLWGGEEDKGTGGGRKRGISRGALSGGEEDLQTQRSGGGR